ncbi:hypothetical protein K501DRAFT_148601, partial [Backusella circina FSU 941]
EEEVFWMLVTIIHDYFPSGIFNEIAHESSLEQTVLMMFIYEKMPGLWSKISSKRCFWECEQKGNLPSITFVTNHWLSSMYLNVLPVETILRVWDCFFVEGFQVLYQVALTIIKLSEPNIWKVNDSVDILQILQKMPNRFVDCHQFMEVIHRF